MRKTLLAVMTQAGVRHEAFLTVVVPESRIARHAKEAGGGVDGRARVLYGVMATLEAGLLGALGATAVVWLDAAGLAGAIRTGFAPGDRAMLRTAELESSGGATGWPMAAAGPSTAPAPERRFYQHDAWPIPTRDCRSAAGGAARWRFRSRAGVWRGARTGRVGVLCYASRLMRQAARLRNTAR
ncbi:MAG: SCO6880 family protein [Jatrophihabitantaceae bacterium]